MLPGDAVVADLDEVVDLGALADPSAAKASPVNARAGPHLDIII